MEAQIYNYKFYINITCSMTIDAMFERLLIASNFTILDQISYNFKPQGYTKLFLLAESHLAIHTFPEKEKTYVELSSCIEEPFMVFIENLLQDYACFFTEGKVFDVEIEENTLH
jgi:S-adenosylmethionine decarboxylase